MKIFCDTNILLEYFQQREKVHEVERVLKYAEENGHLLFISIGSFYTITYLIERYLKEEKLEKEERIEKLRRILRGIFDLFQFTLQSPASIEDGVNDGFFSDLEDSYQAHAALEEGCDVLVTINTKHFSMFSENNTLEILDPQGFIDKFQV